MKYRLLLAVVLSALALIDVLGQDDVDLDSLDHKVKQHLQSNIPGWTHRRGEPITGSSNVLIEKWSSPNRGIKISIVPYKSAARAQEVIRHFLEFDKDVQEVKEIGNEAYAWGWEGTNLVVRKGKYLVYLSAGYDADSDPDLRMLEPNEKRRRQMQEIRRSRMKNGGGRCKKSGGSIRSLQNTSPLPSINRSLEYCVAKCFCLSCSAFLLRTSTYSIR